MPSCPMASVSTADRQKERVGRRRSRPRLGYRYHVPLTPEAIPNEGDAAEDDVLAQQLEVDCSIGVAVQDEAPPFPRCVRWCVRQRQPHE
jgi:hypothetical protein